MNTENTINEAANPACFLGAVSNRVHIISHGKKWAVVKSKAKKATKLYEFREQAYFHARQISDNVVVHDKNGSVLFKYGC